MIVIRDLIQQNRSGKPVGLPCFCTANEHVLRAILENTKKTAFPTVIEATCNQVNQDGGYTGMQPKDFVRWLYEMADEIGVERSLIILGGDHLGPNPWRTEPIESAMEKAKELVRLYVKAGFTKIHLDASMACGSEPNPSFEQIANRAAELCEVAEQYAPEPEKLIYIIGTEVPIPGGETEEPDALDVTSVERFKATIETHFIAWNDRGLTKAWERIVSVVTQPGVDFGHTTVFPFVPEKASALSYAILEKSDLVFEAHSTDYQSTQALHDLVDQHFFFLKVGPELTFRFREAIWALAGIEDQLLAKDVSNVCSIIRGKMVAEPKHWMAYYTGTEERLRLLRTNSYSDRIRYYWADPEVSAAVDKMISNLSKIQLPETLVSQYFNGLEFGEFPSTPEELIYRHVQRCISRYFKAAGQITCG